MNAHTLVALAALDTQASECNVCNGGITQNTNPQEAEHELKK